MKKIFTLIAMALMAIGANAQDISFTLEDAYSESTLSKTSDGLSITVESTNSSKGVDSNSQYFGTADNYVNKTVRVKTGGKSKSTDYIEIGVPTAGTLTLYVRSSSSSADRKLTIDSESFTVSDNNYEEATIEEKTTKVFTPIKLTVAEKKTLKLGYDGGINVYGLSFEASGTIENSKPEITIPQTARTFMSREASIVANVSGYPTPTIKWYSNTTASNEGGTEITDQTAGTLKVTQANVGEYYYYAVATNSEGSTTSNVCTLSVLDPKIPVSENDEIIFPETSYATGSLNGCMFIGGALTLTVNDANNSKISTEDNNSYFGTEENYYQFAKRLKTGGKSDSNNSLKLTTTKAGKLYIYARSGSKDATDRNIILNQDGVEVLNQIFKDSDAITVTKTNSEGEEEKKTVFPVYSCDIKAGDIEITYPVNSMQIYGFSLGSELTGIETVNAPATQSPKAVKCTENGQLVVKKGNNRYNVAGALLK